MATNDGPSEAPRDVLTALPHARPARRSAKRDAPRRPAARKPSEPPQAPRAKVPPAGYATPRGGDAGPEPLRGGELVGTALEAVGELAQFAVTVGVQGLRGVLRRLPRP